MLRVGVQTSGTSNFGVDISIFLSCRFNLAHFNDRGCNLVYSWEIGLGYKVGLGWICTNRPSSYLVFLGNTWFLSGESKICHVLKGEKWDDGIYYFRGQ